MIDASSMAQELAALRASRDLLRTLSATGDLAQTSAAILAAACRLQGIDCGGVYLVDRLTGALRLVAHHGLPPWLVDKIAFYPPEAPKAAIARSGQQVHIDETTLSAQNQTPGFHLCLAAGLRALSLFPVRLHGRVVAVLNIASHTHPQIPTSSREALEIMAAPLGSVLARAQQLDAIRAAFTEIAQELDLPVLLTLIHRHAVLLLGTGMGTLFLWDDTQQLLIPKVWHGHGDQTRDLRLRLGEGAAGAAAQRQEGLIVNDLRSSPLLTPFLRERTRHAAVVAEPLLCRGRLLGAISVDSMDPHRGFGPEDQHLLHLLAGQAAIAIENARLYSQAQEELARRQATEARLRQIARAVEQSPSVVVVTDRNGTIQYVNPKFVEVTGYISAEVMGQNPRILKSGQMPASVYADLWHTITAGQEWRGELLNKKKDGALFWELTSISPVRDPEGTITHFVGVKEDITQRKQTEERLRQSEEKFATVFRTVPDTLAVTRIRDGLILDVNPGFEAVSGWSRDDVVGHTSLEIGLWADPTDRTRMVAALESHGEVLFQTIVFRRKDGTLRTGVYSARSMLFGGEPCILFSMQEVTERTRAEAALQTRTRQLEAVRAVSAEIIRELDLTSVLRLILQRSVDLIGAADAAIFLWDAARERLVPREWTTHGDWMPGLRIRLGEGLLGGVAARRIGGFVNDYRHWPQANPLILERTSITAILAEPLAYRNSLIGVLSLSYEHGDRSFTDADQGILALLATHAAIAIENARLFGDEHTRRRQLDILRRISAEITRELDLPALLDVIASRAQELVRTTGCGVWLWDEQAELLVPHGLDGPGWVKDVPLRLGEGVTGETARRREGMVVNDYPSSPFAHPFWVARTRNRAIIAEPLLYRDRLLGVIAAARDDGTDSFGPEDSHLLRLLADHAAVAIENARLFTELNGSLRDLREAQEALIRNEKLRALGQMAAGIAHDLNNMLSAILGQAELIRLRAEDSAVQDALRVLYTAASDGAQVVRRLLGFGRQKAEGPRVPCDLSTLVNEALELTRPRWRDEAQRQNRLIEIHASLDGLPQILGEPSDIREALTNLILNAVDAMPQGGHLSLTGCVETPQDAADGSGMVVLTLADTGVGMPEEVRRQIFDPFFTTKGVKGTGLGLAMVYGIMQRHGGSIEVASTPGRGTTFTLRFPVLHQPESPAPEAEPTHAPVAAHLLVVDDEAFVRQTLVNLLRAVGHHVLDAENGKLALRLLEENPVDLVLTDLGMPGMTGWEVAQRVKAARPGLPVVLLTGWGHQLPEHQDGRASVDHVLAKPIRLEELQRVLARLLSPR